MPQLKHSLDPRIAVPGFRGYGHSNDGDASLLCMWCHTSTSASHSHRPSSVFDLCSMPETRLIICALDRGMQGGGRPLKGIGLRHCGDPATVIDAGIPWVCACVAGNRLEYNGEGLSRGVDC